MCKLGHIVPDHGMSPVQHQTHIWHNDSAWLTHWGRVTHICVGNLTIVSSDNGLSPGRRQAIIWTNVGILLTGLLGTNFSEILIGIQTFSVKKIHSKMSSGNCRSFCLGLNVLTGPLGTYVCVKWIQIHWYSHKWMDLKMLFVACRLVCPHMLMYNYSKSGWSNGRPWWTIAFNYTIELR